MHEAEIIEESISDGRVEGLTKRGQDHFRSRVQGTEARVQEGIYVY